MQEKTLNNILAFLNRVQLTGQEVPTFNEVANDVLAELSKIKENTQEA